MKTLDYMDNGLEEILAEIRVVLLNNQFDEVVWTGDMNADFTRNGGHVQRLHNYIDEYNMLKAWDAYPIDFTHEHSINDITYVSAIDHFFWNDIMSNNVLEASVIHLAENTSDHHPIYCTIHFCNLSWIKKPKEIRNTKPSWKRVTGGQRNNFNKDLVKQLNKLVVPDSIKECNDTHCQDKSHISCMDEFMTNILETIDMCAMKSLPMPEGKVRIKKNPDCMLAAGSSTI